MENEIYIASKVADTIKTLSPEQQDNVAQVIDSLNGEGWKNSKILASGLSSPDGLRSAHSGDVRVLFRYAPEQHAIIVVDVASRLGQELAIAV